MDTPELQPLADLPEFGRLLLQLLEQQGWLVHVTVPFAGIIDAAGTRGIMVICAHPDVVGPPIRVTGRELADCAIPVLKQASRAIPEIAAARRARHLAA